METPLHVLALVLAIIVLAQVLVLLAWLGARLFAAARRRAQRSPSARAKGSIGEPG